MCGYRTRSNAFVEIADVIFIDGNPACRDFVLWIEDRYLGWSVFVVERPGKGTVREFCVSIVEHYSGAFIPQAVYPAHVFILSLFLINWVISSELWWFTRLIST